MLVNLFDRRHVGLIVLLQTISLKNVSFTSQNKLRELFIPASNLIRSLMNSVFSVLFKKYWQSVLCVISESFDCLFVLIYTVSQKVLRFISGDVSRKSFSAPAIPLGWWCVFPCWIGRKLIVFVNIKYAFPGYLTAPRSFYFHQQFFELHKHHTAYRITCCQKPITCSSRCVFPQGRKFQ